MGSEDVLTEEMRNNIAKTIEKVINSDALDFAGFDNAVGRREARIKSEDDATEEIRDNVAKTIDKVIQTYALDCDQTIQGINVVMDEEFNMSSDEQRTPETKFDYHGHSS